MQQDRAVGRIAVVSMAKPIARHDVHFHRSNADGISPKPQLDVSKVRPATATPTPWSIDADGLLVEGHQWWA
jgi:hypothetical protein